MYPVGFKRCGSSARPAGLPRPAECGGLTICGPTPLDNVSIIKGGVFGQHALRQCSPFAQAFRPDWQMREANVHSHQSVRASGISPINNTYLPAPLKPVWGKARELSPIELQPKPREQVPDLLWSAKCMAQPRALTIDEMMPVRPDFSSSIPMFRDKFDPQRLEAGFIRSPNVSRGAAYAPPSPIPFGQTQSPSATGTFKLDKFSYNMFSKDHHSQTLALGTSRIPVCKAWLQ